MHEQSDPTASSSAGRVTDRLDTQEVAESAPSGASTGYWHDRNRLLALLLIGLGLAMLLSNIGRLPFSFGSLGRTTTYGVEVPLDDIKAAQVRIDWGSAPFQLNAGGSGYLVAGSVEARREPEVKVEHDDDSAEVTIRDSRRIWPFGASTGAYGHLLLDPTAIFRLEFNLGSGPAEIDLSKVRVSQLELDAGSGSVELRLPAQGTTQASLDAGSGSLNIALPRGGEARVELDRGSGSFSAGDRLRQVEGDRDDAVYQTLGYDAAPNRIDIKIDGGSGSINIR